MLGLKFLGPVRVDEHRYFPMKLARPESNEKRLV